LYKEEFIEKREIILLKQMS